MATILDYKDLKVWQRSRKLCKKVYLLMGELPKEEKFGLISQIKRAVISVPANIAEGFDREHVKDRVMFFRYAEGSLSEMENYLILIQDLDLVETDISQILEEVQEIRKMLSRFISQIR